MEMVRLKYSTNERVGGKKEEKIINIRREKVP